MKYLKKYESYTDLTYTIDGSVPYDDRVTITGYLNGTKIGEIIIEFCICCMWMFEDIISEEKYDELFPDDKFAKIEHLDVDDQYKRKGYAKQLMNKGLEYIKDEGENVVYLNASPMGFSGLNIYDLVEFYKLFGFRTFHEEDNNEEMILEL